MKLSFKDFLIFVKIRITASVSISAILGYLLFSNSIEIDILLLWLGVLLLSSGSAALNQAQEWKYDQKMHRTRNRPIPKGTISSTYGFIVSLLLIALGSLILFVGTESSLPFWLGILAVVIYNLIYTPLKRHSPYAAIPGALIGAIPPMIGWTFAGGELLHPLNISVAMFFFIWQIPHFWLLLIVYEDDYRKAGFPVLTDILTPLQIARVSYLWIVTLVLVSLFIITLLDNFSLSTFLVVLSLGIYLLFRIHRMVKVAQPQKFYKFAFINLNLFVAVVTLVLSMQKILNF